MSLPISFEFFPPKTDEQRVVLNNAHRQLSEYKPEYFSVTFGAGGSTREFTRDTVMDLHERYQNATPHLSCLGASVAEIEQLLNDYREAGINRLVALRGDMPSGMASAGELRYANELVEFARAKHGNHFNIQVACYPEFHPQCETAAADLRNFKRKVDAGADGAITQYFFNADAYFRFVDDCTAVGIDIPIVPGIMPITNYSQLARFSEMCGAELPRWLRKRLRDFGDDRAAIASFGVEFITDMCQRLIDGGAPGLHFYTLNRAKATKQICQGLGLNSAE
ncbi:MAG: methylenetetrahydrofolate reductase [Lysobacteraceae bacterium]|nr:MAG: methylenetetrahydrofolate reductase [Xanthomonadaceae bacterium]